MTDNEIIKAFEHCELEHGCWGCPLAHTQGCQGVAKEILDIITDAIINYRMTHESRNPECVVMSSALFKIIAGNKADSEKSKFGVVKVAEYIERESLIKKAKELANIYSYCGLASVHIIKAIEDAPSEDVVKVVRCKDCIEFIQTNSCDGVCGLDYHKVNFDSYCSEGNRK